MNGPKERHGRVVDKTGAPVPGARIVIVLSTFPMPEIALNSDEDGHFSLRLPPGRFTLRAHGPADLIGEAEVEGESADEIVIVIGG